MTIEWDAFLQVFVASLIGALLVVTFYAIGLRLLVRAGKIPVAPPAEFTDAIAVITPKEAERAARRAAKAAKKSPLTPAQRRVALIGAYASFAVSGGAVLAGILMLVFQPWK